MPHKPRVTIPMVTLGYEIVTISNPGTGCCGFSCNCQLILSWRQLWSTTRSGVGGCGNYDSRGGNGNCYPGLLVREPVPGWENSGYCQHPFANLIVHSIVSVWLTHTKADRPCKPLQICGHTLNSQNRIEDVFYYLLVLQHSFSHTSLHLWCGK